MAKRKRSPKDDPQQYEVYRMEDDIIGPKQARLSRKAIRQLCDGITSAFGVPDVGLRFRSLGPWAAQCTWAGNIRIGTKWSSYHALTVLHELSHHIHNRLNEKGREQQAHGPEFMACYMVVLDVARVLPVTCMRALCKKHKVKFLDPGEDRCLKRLKSLIS